MSFVSILEKIGMIAGVAAPQIISIVDPPLGAIAGTVLNAVIGAESKFGPGNGANKKQDALSAVQVAVPLILSVVKASTGKELVDAAALASGLGKLNDAIVELLNAFRILPKPSAQ